MTLHLLPFPPCFFEEKFIFLFEIEFTVQSTLGKPFNESKNMRYSCCTYTHRFVLWYHVFDLFEKIWSLSFGFKALKNAYTAIKFYKKSIGIPKIEEFDTDLEPMLM
jgi:hypothetical protein